MDAVCPFCNSKAIWNARHDSDWGSGNSFHPLNGPDVGQYSEGEIDVDINTSYCESCGEFGDFGEIERLVSKFEEGAEAVLIPGSNGTRQPLIREITEKEYQSLVAVVEAANSALDAFLGVPAMHGCKAAKGLEDALNDHEDRRKHGEAAHPTISQMNT